ncbi:MAG: RCC1 domain-containing protein [Acidimicrobiales bacterium]
MRPFPALAAAAAVVTLMGATATAAAGASAGPGWAPADDAARGIHYDGLVPGAATGPCGGKLALTSGDGCTHGPDPAPAGVDVRARQDVPALAPTAAATTVSPTVACYGDGQSGPRVQLMYAHAANVADRSATMAPIIRQVAAQVDAVFVTSSAQTGGVRHVRYVTGSGAACTTPTVLSVTLPTGSDATFTDTINELRNQGFSASDRKYLVWVDAAVYCGIAQAYNDDSVDRVGGSNYSNGRATVAGEVARVDSGCWDLPGGLVEAHELMHTLGAVQASAPHATGAQYGHCTDDYDRMCYDDGSGRTVTVVCPNAVQEQLYDCNHDDYFSTSPAAGSYLATHWDTAENVFLSAAGSVSSWGSNMVGQLGDATTTDRSARVQSGAPTDVVAVAGGGYHSLAVRSDHSVVAWGWNPFGALGDGTAVARTTPVTVPGLSSVVAVAAGAYHSVALRSDGTVWSWGFNGYGALGDGTTTTRYTPAQVPGLTGVVAVAAGAFHTLAVKSDGTVWAWGFNAFGQVGDGTVVSRTRPVQVSGLSGVTAVSGGAYHSLALRADGTVRAWGWNGVGQLGDGTLTDRHTPVAATGVAGVRGIAAGYFHSVVVTTADRVLSWGSNLYGQLGDGTLTDRHTAVTSSVPAAVAVAAGAYHTVALGVDGRSSAWGYNGAGQVGDTTTANRATANRATATPVAGVSTATVVAAGAFHTLSA